MLQHTKIPPINTEKAEQQPTSRRNNSMKFILPDNAKPSNPWGSYNPYNTMINKNEIKKYKTKHKYFDSINKEVLVELNSNHKKLQKPTVYEKELLSRPILTDYQKADEYLKRKEIFG